MVKNPGSNSLPQVIFLMGFLSPSKEIQGEYLNWAMAAFFPIPYQILMPYDITYSETLTVLLNKPQTSQDNKQPSSDSVRPGYRFRASLLYLPLSLSSADTITASIRNLQQELTI
jgi:hypothetical protein